MADDEKLEKLLKQPYNGQKQLQDQCGTYSGALASPHYPSASQEFPGPSLPKTPTIWACWIHWWSKEESCCSSTRNSMSCVLFNSIHTKLTCLYSSSLQRQRPGRKRWRRQQVVHFIKARRHHPWLRRHHHHPRRNQWHWVRKQYASHSHPNSQEVHWQIQDYWWCCQSAQQDVTERQLWWHQLFPIFCQASLHLQARCIECCYLWGPLNLWCKHALPFQGVARWP